jgi:centrosomal protein CEP120
MSDIEDNYSDDFEQPEAQEVKSVQSVKSSHEMLEEEHQLRLSIELHSIKDFTLPGQIYVKFNYSLLGPAQGRTTPLAIRRNTEHRLENGFQAHDFAMTKSRLYPALNSTPLKLEVWSTDKYAKDTQLGTVNIKTDELLKSPLKKTHQSVVRIYDSWHNIEGEEGVIGQIRVILYLEDKGPRRPGAALAQNVPVDSQTVYEIEMWKRNEESKWRATLKERENQHLAMISQEWQEKENERERQFQRSIAEIAMMEQKIRTRALDLQKREQKLVNLEEELRHKINDTTRQLGIKEEELQTLKTRFNETKTALMKENKSLNAKIETFKNELTKTEDELRKAKREQDSVAVQTLQQELNSKNLQMYDTERKLEQMTQVKDSFKAQCDKLKSELTRVLRAHDDEKRKWEAEQREEVNRLRLEMETQRLFKEESPEVKALKMQIEELKMNLKENIPRPEVPKTRAPVLKSSYDKGLVMPTKIETPYLLKDTTPKQTDEITRLIQEREELLSCGAYTEDDAVIEELDRQIAALR